MRMHPAPAARPPLRTSKTASFASTALPLLLASAGMITIAAALILDHGVLVLAGAGLAVIGTATYLIIAGLDRADRKEAEKSRARGSQKNTRSEKADLPRRGPLADAAVDALTRSDGPGGVWPPLSSEQSETRPQTVWDTHGKVGPESFHDSETPQTSAQSRPAAQSGTPRHPNAPAHAAAGEQEAMVEFAPVEPHNRSASPSPSPSPSQGPTEAWQHEPAPQSQRVEPQATDRDLRVWPGANDLGLWERWSGRQEEGRMSEARRASSMKERRERLAARLPTVGAILSSGEKQEEPPDDGATRGKCSSCQRYLWAPPTRPITLKCPGCGHKARLY